MQTFKDKDGVEWHIDISLGTIKFIEAHDFAEAMHVDGPVHIQFFPPTENLFTELLLDPAICFDIIWCCVQDQIERHEVATKLDFAKRFDGDTLVRSREALYEELPNFFSESRTILKTLYGRCQQAQKQLSNKLEKIADTYLSAKKIEQLVDQRMQEVESELQLQQIRMEETTAELRGQ